MISSQKIQNIINGEYNKFEKMKLKLNIQEDRIKKMDSNITDIIDSTVCFIFHKSKEMCPTLSRKILDICSKFKYINLIKRDREKLEKEQETLKRNKEEVEKKEETLKRDRE